ncbi:MAG: spore germination protein [Paenibacillaceae bacterium]
MRGYGDAGKTSKKRIVLFFLDGMVDKQSVDNVVSSLLDRTPPHRVTIQMLKECVLHVGEINLVQSVEQAMDQVLSGGLLVLLDGFDAIMYISEVADDALVQLITSRYFSF